MFVEKLREITKAKENRVTDKEVYDLTLQCERRLIKAAETGSHSEKFVINYKKEACEYIYLFEKWMLDEGLTFTTNKMFGTTNKITYHIDW